MDDALKMHYPVEQTGLQGAREASSAAVFEEAFEGLDKQVLNVSGDNSAALEPGGREPEALEFNDPFKTDSIASDSDSGGSRAEERKNEETKTIGQSSFHFTDGKLDRIESNGYTLAFHEDRGKWYLHRDSGGKFVEIEDNIAVDWESGTVRYQENQPILPSPYFYLGINDGAIGLPPDIKLPESVKFKDIEESSPLIA